MSASYLDVACHVIQCDLNLRFVLPFTRSEKDFLAFD